MRKDNNELGKERMKRMLLPFRFVGFSIRCCGALFLPHTDVTQFPSVMKVLAGDLVKHLSLAIASLNDFKEFQSDND